MGPIGPPTSPAHADPDYCLATVCQHILADAAIAAVASSIWDRGTQGSQDSLCGPHSGLPQVSC